MQERFLKKHRRNEISHQKFYKDYKERILKDLEKFADRRSKIKINMRFAGGKMTQLLHEKSSFNNKNEDIKI